MLRRFVIDLAMLSKWLLCFHIWCQPLPYVFTVSSADDPYMLYAAMYSGLNTYILSNDEMRDARFLLGDKLSERFKLWQRHRQIKFRGLWQNNEKTVQAHFVVIRLQSFEERRLMLTVSYHNA
jgi:hypothetical protein